MAFQIIISLIAGNARAVVFAGRLHKVTQWLLVTLTMDDLEAVDFVKVKGSVKCSFFLMYLTEIEIEKEKVSCWI